VDWTQPLPPASLRWAEAQAGARVIAALPMESRWLANHLVVLADGRELVLRRWARPGWDDDDPDLTAAREALVLGRLADSEVPAPELVAADVDASTCDVPALLITRMPGAAFPGRPPLGPLADALEQIHAVDPDGIPAYQRYYEPERLRVPSWADDRTVWEDAIALAHEPAPTLPERFIHRDFHPGNVLWTGGAVTGVVDWASTSIGAPSADIGHCRMNLAGVLGLAAADRFLAFCGRAAEDYHPYWDIVAALGGFSSATFARWTPHEEEFLATAVGRL
jgi:aminoglycoside phosphotransferase (APT) family kinase protein